jgi:hypothetical protein
MKTIFKYLIIAGCAGTNVIKRAALLCCLMLLFESSYGQYNSFNAPPSEMHYFNFGVSDIFINRQAFDNWTMANYNLKENRNANFLLDVGDTEDRFDSGVSLNVGSSFAIYSAYIGYRLTRNYSPIASWLNIEAGEFLGIFTNIAPLNYVRTPDQVGQNLELHYDNGFVGLMSKNYLNFLHFNIKMGKVRIPFNSGFFVSAGYQPGSRDWRYGYYNTDTVFVSTKIHTIPKLSKLQVNTGVFVGF